MKLSLLVILGFLACSAMGQGFIQDDNLAGRKVCFIPTGVNIFISIKNPEPLSIDVLRKSIVDEVVKRLTLSRIEYLNLVSCLGLPLSKRLWLSVDVEATAGPRRAWYIRLEMYVVGMPDWPAKIVVWADSSFGFNSFEGDELSSFFVSVLRDKLDGFALSWIKMNP